MLKFRFSRALTAAAIATASLLAGPATAAQAAAGPTPSPCVAPGSNQFNRTFACDKVLRTLPITIGQTRGSLKFITSHDIKLNYLGTTYTDDITVEFLSYDGNASIAGLTITVGATCSGTCTSRVQPSLVNIPAVVGTRAVGQAIFTDSTTTENTSAINFSFTPTEPGTVARPFTENSPPVRCDNKISAQGAGCVFPSFVPTFTLSLSDPKVAEVAQHVADAQQLLPGHPGRRGDGTPLRRETNETTNRQSRAIACPPSTPRPAGKSCDEYPMASTKQGAKYRGPFSARMVDATQNSTAGNAAYLKGTYTKNRILDNDEFWVSVTA